MRRAAAFLRRCWVCTAKHLHLHRKKYASAAMIYGALIYFAADAAFALSVLPHWLVGFVETHRWSGPAAALLGHAGFILELERAA